MMPYLREKKIKGFRSKIDNHIHINNRKVGNWWEDFDTDISRRTLKQKLAKEEE